MAKQFDYNKIMRLADELGDNRSKAEVGDKAFAQWFDENHWWSFVIEKLDTDINGGMNLGFSHDGGTYDIGLAHQVVVIK